MSKIKELRTIVADMLDDCHIEVSLRKETKEEETAKMNAALKAGDAEAYAKAQTEINRLNYNDVSESGFMNALAWVLIQIDDLYEGEGK